MSANREFNFTDVDFKFLCDFAFQQTGISLSEHKEQMVYSRVARRLRELGLSEFAEYCSVLASGNQGEILEFNNAITTNLTYFFREKHHFEFLSDTIITDMMVEIREQQKDRFRIWSAGCSYGLEPYSIAMVMREKAHAILQKDFKILATDIDTNVLDRAKIGSYPDREFAGVNGERQKRWFTPVESDHLQANKSLRELISFKQLNLTEPLPMRGPFDVIFCRNVLIYFEKTTQAELMARFYNVLKPNGYLIIGHSESLHNVTDDFESLGNTIYQKKTGGGDE